MRYVIEFPGGNYLQHLHKYVAPCSLQNALRFNSSREAEAAIRANKWIVDAHGFPTHAATFTTGDKIECPKCGCMNGDLWEHFLDAEGTTEIDCGECEEPIILSRAVSYSYTATEKGPA